MESNTFNSTYDSGSGVRTNSNYSPYTSVPRQWLIFAQYLGTFFSVLGLIVYISFMQRIYNALPSGELASKATVALLLAVIVYFVWRSIYTAFVIIRWAKNSTDEELCANRYIISALSLGVGGFFTPFLLTAFPNIKTSSTINPRYFLSRTMGFCLLIGAPILALTYFITVSTGINGATSIKDIFDASATMGIISIVVLTISLAALILGAVTSGLFFSYRKNNNFDYNNPSKLFKTISTIWMIIMSIELSLVIFSAILRLLAAFIDFFRSGEQGRGFLVMLLMLVNLMITFSYVWMVVYITTRTIAGLWSVDGTVTIPKYNHNTWAREHVTSAKTAA